MIFYPLSAIINALTSTVVFILALIRNPRSSLNRSFTYFAVSVALWSYCYFFWQISQSAPVALFWCRALMAGAIFIPATFLHFSVTLVGQYNKHRKNILFWYGLSLLFLVLDFTPQFISDVRPRLWFHFWPTAAWAYAPFLAMFGGLTIYAHYLMFKYGRKLSASEINKIRYVFVGTAIGFLGGMTNYPLWYDIPIPPIGNILVSVYVAMVFYAIVKYRLMDIRMALTGVGIFSAVYFLVLGLPFWIGYQTKSWIWSTSFAVALATLGPLIVRFLHTRAERRILANEIRKQETLR